MAPDYLPRMVRGRPGDFVVFLHFSHTSPVEPRTTHGLEPRILPQIYIKNATSPWLVRAIRGSSVLSVATP